MKNSFNHPIILSIFAALILCMVSCTTESIKNNITKSETPQLLERKANLATAAEWDKTKTKVTELLEKIKAKPNEIPPRLQLATIFMSEARITGEHPYYYPATLQILEDILRIKPDCFEAMVYKASVKMSQHEFVEAREIATKALTVNANNAYVYGVLVDANVELGDYKTAIAMSDKMQALKPSLESYSRASYLREIHGDYTGAIEAMSLAVQAGLPGSEPYCWSKYMLAQLLAKSGKTKEANALYEEILASRPSYAFALSGLGEVSLMQKDYDKAITYFDKAAAIMPEFSFFELKADAYQAKGFQDKTNELLKEVETMLAEDAASGHKVSLEMAKLYLKMGKPDEALPHALEEYKIRPDNIDVNDVLSQVYFAQKDLARSVVHTNKALVTNKKDPELLKHAANVYAMNGEVEKARNLLGSN